MLLFLILHAQLNILLLLLFLLVYFSKDLFLTSFYLSLYICIVSNLLNAVSFFAILFNIVP